MDKNKLNFKVNNSQREVINQVKLIPTYDIPANDNIDVISSMMIVNRQMKVEGLRERTVYDYNNCFNRFCDDMNIAYIQEITIDKLYTWLNGLTELKPNSKANKLRSVSAILLRFYNNGWYQNKFWKNVKIKIDEKVKEATKDSDLDILLTLLDKNTFTGLRDSIAIILLYRTGIRIRTLGELRERHIDFDNLCLNLEGAIMKNHKFLKLPIDEELAELLKLLIEENHKIRKSKGVKNDYVFITNQGLFTFHSSNTNLISKQLGIYAKKFNLKNINPHSIRRAFSLNLHKKGVSVAIISKSLGHQDISTTSKYLSLTVDEVAENLRKYL